MKEEYDTTLRDELQALETCMKNEFHVVQMQMEVSFKNKLASQMEEQRNFLRQDLLKEKLNLITDTGETTRLSIATLLEEKVKMTKANQELERALERSKQEIERLARNKNKAWWQFSK